MVIGECTLSVCLSSFSVPKRVASHINTLCDALVAYSNEAPENSFHDLLQCSMTFVPVSLDYLSKLVLHTSRRTEVLVASGTLFIESICFVEDVIKPVA